MYCAPFYLFFYLLPTCGVFTGKVAFKNTQWLIMSAWSCFKKLHCKSGAHYILLCLVYICFAVLHNLILKFMFKTLSQKMIQLPLSLTLHADLSDFLPGCGIIGEHVCLLDIKHYLLFSYNDMDLPGSEIKFIYLFNTSHLLCSVRLWVQRSYL